MGAIALKRSQMKWLSQLLILKEKLGNKLG